MIGVFDSGVGGLSVFLELKKLLPKQSFYYFADSKNAPYGIKSPKKIQKLTLKALKFLEKNSVDLIIIACNTATVSGIEYYRKFIKIPIVGLVPAIKPAAKVSKTIGVFTTGVTKNSPLLKRYIELFAKNRKVVTLSSSKLVEFVESHDFSSAKFIKEIKRLVSSFESSKIDSLVFGCTHFVFLKPYFNKYFSYPIKYFDSGYAVAKQTRRLLKNAKNNQKEDVFVTTGDPKRFSKIASLLIGKKLKTGKVNL